MGLIGKIVGVTNDYLSVDLGGYVVDADLFLPPGYSAKPKVGYLAAVMELEDNGNYVALGFRDPGNDPVDSVSIKSSGDTDINGATISSDSTVAGTDFIAGTVTLKGHSHAGDGLPPTTGAV